MEMLQLNDLLPKEQWEEYWTILGEQHEELPDNKEYVIFEHYCTNPACDCKTLVADIKEIGSNGRAIKQSAAVIDYDWSSEKTSCAPTFNAQSPKTKNAINLLAVYQKHVHNLEYLNKIKSEYARVKILATQKQTNKTENAKKNIGRNDLCHCGSDKKYKKCCLTKDLSQAR